MDQAVVVGAFAETVADVYCNEEPTVVGGRMAGTTAGTVKLMVFSPSDGETVVVRCEGLSGDPPDLLGGVICETNGHPLAVTKTGEIVAYLGITTIHFTPVAEKT